jgi:hypothetical protein
MAKKTSVDVDTPETETEQTSNHAPGTQPAPFDMNQLGQTIGNAVAAGMAVNAPPRKMTIGEYVRRGAINQNHPDPKVRLKFDREYYQSGRLIEFATTYDREVELLNQITHSGRYVNRLVEVVVVPNGSEEAVDIRFSNKPNFAFELKGHARNFTDMLGQIVAAQKLEREEMEDDKAERAERRRNFGAGKATREARERAGA